MSTTLLLAADHAGFALKEALKPWLVQQGYAVQDFGTHSADSMDYPDVIHPMAIELHRLREAGQSDAWGIAICGSGQGVCMTANHHAGIRAALVWTPEVAALARQHNDANVLCLPARLMHEDDARAAITTFLTTAFEGGRHERRVAKMDG